MPEQESIPVAGSPRVPAGVVPNESGGTDCQTCGPAAGPPSPPSFVYATGRIEPRFPLLSVEKEFAQAIGRAATQNLSDRQALHHALTRPENRYLIRQLCWVMTLAGLETYILVPRDPADFHLLVESLRPTPHATDVDVVIGLKGPITQPAMCNGLMVPIVAFDQIYSFDFDSFIKSIPRPEKIESEQFRAVAEEVFAHLIQLADNAGSTDEHRAINYLLMRYPGIYATVAEAHAQNASLSAVEARPSALSGTRRILEVIFIRQPQHGCGGETCGACRHNR